MAASSEDARLSCAVDVYSVTMLIMVVWSTSLDLDIVELELAEVVRCKSISIGMCAQARHKHLTYLPAS